MFFVLCSSVAFSQSSSQLASLSSEHEYVKTINTQKWKCENKGKWGSFWWSVDRTVKKQKDGFYYYYIYFYSNSYLNKKINDTTYAKAITYIVDVKITMLKDRHEFNLPYVLVGWESENGAYFYHVNADRKFTIDFYSASPYSYENGRK